MALGSIEGFKQPAMAGGISGGLTAATTFAATKDIKATAISFAVKALLDAAVAYTDRTNFGNDKTHSLVSREVYVMATDAITSAVAVAAAAIASKKLGGNVTYKGAGLALAGSFAGNVVHKFAAPYIYVTKAQLEDAMEITRDGDRAGINLATAVRDQAKVVELFGAQLEANSKLTDGKKTEQELVDAVLAEAAKAVLEHRKGAEIADQDTEVLFAVAHLPANSTTEEIKEQATAAEAYAALRGALQTALNNRTDVADAQIDPAHGLEQADLAHLSNAFQAEFANPINVTAQADFDEVKAAVAALQNNTKEAVLAAIDGAAEFKAGNAFHANMRKAVVDAEDGANFQDIVANAAYAA